MTNLLSLDPARTWLSNIPEGIPTKTFATRDVLTVTARRLLTEAMEPTQHDISSVFLLLDYMTGDSAVVHTLPRFAAECRPWLTRWYPGLEAVEMELQFLDQCLSVVNEQDPSDCHRVLENWLSRTLQRLHIPDNLEIPRIPPDDHIRKDPSDELVEILGGSEDRIVRIELNQPDLEDPADYWKKG